MYGAVDSDYGYLDDPENDDPYGLYEPYYGPDEFYEQPGPPASPGRPGPPDREPGHRRTPEPPRGKGWKTVQWASFGLAGVLLLGSVGGYVAYRQLMGNVKDIPEPEDPNYTPPDKLNNSMNILLMGSDTREGENTKYGKTAGARSDASILLHLSAGGKKATAISFPRDSLVDMPACRTPDGGTWGPSRGMINTAFTFAGPACTKKTIETLTKIRIDHFLVIDFAGFRDIVNALGGVTVCSPKAFTDPKSKLTMKAGVQKINGEQALGWVRTRYKLGDGSDLGRIKRQQQLMSSVLNKVKSQGLLGDPKKLLAFINAVTKSLSADKGFNGKAMFSLAKKMKDIDLKQVKFQTVPWAYSGPRVVWQQPAADNLFTAIREDNAVPADVKQAQKNSGKKPSVAPSSVKVKVYNGTRQDGLAGRAVTKLTSMKYVATLGSTSTYKNGTLAQTVVTYGPGGEAAALQLAALLVGKVEPVARATDAPGSVSLYLGADFTGLRSTAPVKIPKVKDEFDATTALCKTNT